jgi:hypothetical protein
VSLDLTKFCDPERGGKTTAAPWTLGEFTYAVDGFIAVRVARQTLEGILDAPDEQKGADYIAGLIAAGDRAKAEPVPALPDCERENCGVCRGCKRVVECDECYGQGSRECDLGHDHDCESCDGRGVFYGLGSSSDTDTKRCPVCHGEGWLPNFADNSWRGPVVMVHNGRERAFSYRNMHRLHMLPGVVWHLPESPDDPAVFWFDGGEGVVMPMRWHPDKDGKRSPNALYVDEPAEAVA